MFITPRMVTFPKVSSNSVPNIPLLIHMRKSNGPKTDESAKSGAWCAFVLACLCVCILMWLVCFCAWHACVLGLLGMLMCLTCLHACMLDVLLCLCALHAYVLAMMKCFTFLHVCMLGMLSIGILTFLSNYLICLHKSRLCN